MKFKCCNDIFNIFFLLFQIAITSKMFFVHILCYTQYVNLASANLMNLAIFSL